MADLTLEQASNTVSTEGALSIPTNSYADIARKKALNKSRADTDFFSAETFDAARTAFGQNNYINMGIEKAQLWLNTREHEDDKNFIEQNSDERVNMLLREHGLPQNDFFELREANNAVNEGIIIDTLLDKQYAKNFAQKHLSNGMMATMNVTGSLLDLDVALLGPLTATLSKGKKIADIAKTAFAIEAGAVPVRDYLDPQYDPVRDGFLDITVGVVLETSVAKYLNKDFDANLKFQRELAVKNQEDAERFIAEGEEFWKRMQLEDEAKALEEQQIVTAKEASARLKEQNAKRLEEIHAEKAKMDAEAKALEEQQILDVNQASARLKEQNAKRLEEIREEQARLKEDAENLEARLTQERQEMKEQQRIAVEKANEQVRLENEIKAAKKELKELKKAQLDAKHKLEGQQRKVETKEMREKSKQITELQKAKKEAELAESDARLKERNLQTKQRLDANKKRIDDTVATIAGNLGKELERIKAQLTEIATNQTKTQRQQDLNDLEDIIEGLSKEYPDLAKDVIDSFKNIKAKNKELKENKGFSMAQKMGLAGLATVGVANAGDFGDTDSGTGLGQFMIAAALLAFATPKAIRSVKKNGMTGLVKRSASTISNIFKMSEYTHTPSGNKITKAVDAIHQKANTAFNSMYQELLAFKDPRVKKIADELLLNPIDGKNGSVDVEKMSMLHGDQALVQYVLKGSYREWLSEQKLGKSDSWFKTVELQAKFNKLVSDGIEGKAVDSPAIQAAVKEMRKVIKQALDYAKEVKVKGADGVESTPTYLPRLWNFNLLGQVVKSGDKEAIEQFTKNLAEVIKSPNPYDTAKRMVGWFADSKNFEGRHADDVLERLEEFLKEGIDRTAAKQALGTEKEKASRLKHRIDIDLHAFKPVTVNIDGNPVKIGLDNMVERDISTIMDSYLNQMYGSIALAKRGYPSVGDLRRDINEIGGEAKEVLDTIVNLTLGVPLRINNRPVHEVATTMRNVTFVAALKLVAFAMTVEAIKTISNTGLGLGLKNFKGAFKEMDKETSLYHTISSLTGLGTHKIRDKVDIKGLDNSDFGELDTKSWFGRTSTEMVQTAAKVFGLVKGTDIMESFTMLKSTDNLARFVHGKDNDIPKARLESYGITDDVKEMFKDDFKFNEADELLNFDPKNWTYEKRAKFNNILMRMNQEITPQSVIGTMGRWTKDNELGRLFSFLLNYPLNIYANQAVKDAHFMDARSAANLVYSFGGAYIGLMARYEAEGREYEHEDLILYAMLNLPSLAIFSSMKSLSDPATVQTASGFKDDIAILAGTVSGTSDNGNF